MFTYHSVLNDATKVEAMCVCLYVRVCRRLRTEAVVSFTDCCSPLLSIYEARSNLSDLINDVKEYSMY